MLNFLQKNIGCGWRISPPAARSRTMLAYSLAMLGGGLCSFPAAAAISDTITPFVATTYSYDDNLFRLSDSVSGFDGGRSDTSKQIQAGFLFNRPIGRQVLSGQAKWSKVSFDHFNQLDYGGKDFQAALEWHLGNHVDGHVGGTYTQSLTSFTDFQSTDRNLRTSRREYADANWRFHPSWQVRAGIFRDRYGYDLYAQRFNNRSERALEAGVDYLASSGSRVGLQLRKVTTDYDTAFSSNGLLIDQGFEQDEVKANIYWRFSGVTQFQFLGGWVTRKHDFFTGRDASGLNGRAIAYWAPLGKVRFTGTVWREFSVVENTLVNTSLNKGASLAAMWDISAKVRADAQVRREKRDFTAISSIVLPGDASDTTSIQSLGLTYAPTRTIQLGANLFHETRSGSAVIGTNSYRAQGISFNASAQF